MNSNNHTKYIYLNPFHLKMMRFPSTFTALAAKRVLANARTAPAAFTMRMMATAPSVKVRNCYEMKYMRSHDDNSNEDDSFSAQMIDQSSNSYSTFGSYKCSLLVTFIAKYV